MIRNGFELPNQGSNLDFTDPESVVLPITPLGTVYGCKNTLFLFHARKKRVFFEFVKKIIKKLKN